GGGVNLPAGVRRRVGRWLWTAPPPAGGRCRVPLSPRLVVGRGRPRPAVRRPTRPPRRPTRRRRLPGPRPGDPPAARGRSGRGAPAPPGGRAKPVRRGPRPAGGGDRGHHPAPLAGR